MDFSFSILVEAQLSLVPPVFMLHSWYSKVYFFVPGEICAFKIHSQDVPFEAVVLNKTSGEGLLQAKSPIDCELQKEYTFIIQAYDCGARPGGTYWKKSHKWVTCPSYRKAQWLAVSEYIQPCGVHCMEVSWKYSHFQLCFGIEQWTLVPCFKSCEMSMPNIFGSNWYFVNFKWSSNLVALQLVDVKLAATFTSTGSNN